MTVFAGRPEVLVRRSAIADWLWCIMLLQVNTKRRYMSHVRCSLPCAPERKVRRSVAAGSLWCIMPLHQNVT